MQDSDIPQLNEISRDLRIGRQPPTITIRKFMEWFGVKRRSYWNRDYIDKQLEACGLFTEPNYKDTWVDDFVTIRLRVPQGPGSSEEKEEEKDTDDMAEQDLSFRVSRLPSAKQKPLCVSPSAPLSEAYTKLLLNNFSQLPVTTSERELKGVISWASIGKRLSNGISGEVVAHFMEDACETSLHSSIFEVIKMIFEKDYVIVRAPDRKISGIVTAADLSNQLGQLTTPFLLLNEIENYIRRLLQKNLSNADLLKFCAPQAEQSGQKPIDDVSDLTFGQYVFILQNPAAWDQIKLRIDRNYFCSELDRTRNIRNEVMHFDPDPLAVEDLQRLSNFSSLLASLHKMGAF